MATSAHSAFGTYLKMGDGGDPETFTTIAEVKDISGPSLTTETEDVTSHDSPSGHIERIATLIDTGEISFDINLIPAGATHNETTGLAAAARDKLAHNFKVVFPTGSKMISGPAIVTGIEYGAEVAGVLGASVTLTPCGLWTVGAAS